MTKRKRFDHSRRPTQTQSSGRSALAVRAVWNLGGSCGDVRWELQWAPRHPLAVALDTLQVSENNAEATREGQDRNTEEAFGFPPRNPRGVRQ